MSKFVLKDKPDQLDYRRLHIHTPIRRTKLVRVYVLATHQALICLVEKVDPGEHLTRSVSSHEIRYKLDYKLA